MIQEAKYIISSPDVASCPQSTLPEYAFIGRSNVGKSSLINMLCHNPKLAKTSQKPGKRCLSTTSWWIIPGIWWTCRATATRRRDRNNARR